MYPRTDSKMCEIAKFRPVKRIQYIPLKLPFVGVPQEKIIKKLKTSFSQVIFMVETLTSRELFPIQHYICTYGSKVHTQTELRNTCILGMCPTFSD